MRGSSTLREIKCKLGFWDGKCVSEIGGHTFLDYLELGVLVKNWSA